MYNKKETQRGIKLLLIKSLKILLFTDFFQLVQFFKLLTSKSKLVLVDKIKSNLKVCMHIDICRRA